MCTISNRMCLFRSVLSGYPKGERVQCAVRSPLSPRQCTLKKYTIAVVMPCSHVTLTLVQEVDQTPLNVRACYKT